ncbi:MAG: cyclase [Acidimicrobiales bacterium]
MKATLIVRHQVTDYASWRKVFDEAEPLRVQYGSTGHHVMHFPGDPNDLVAIHHFASVAQAEAFAGDPTLKADMQRGGVIGAPRIEIVEDS